MNSPQLDQLSFSRLCKRVRSFIHFAGRPALQKHLRRGHIHFAVITSQHRHTRAICAELQGFLNGRKHSGLRYLLKWQREAKLGIFKWHRVLSGTRIAVKQRSNNKANELTSPGLSELNSPAHNQSTQSQSLAHTIHRSRGSSNIERQERQEYPPTTSHPDLIHNPGLNNEFTDTARCRTKLWARSINRSSEMSSRAPESTLKRVVLTRACLMN